MTITGSLSGFWLLRNGLFARLIRKGNSKNYQGKIYDAKGKEIGALIYTSCDFLDDPQFDLMERKTGDESHSKDGLEWPSIQADQSLLPKDHEGSNVQGVD